MRVHGQTRTRNTASLSTTTTTWCIAAHVKPMHLDALTFSCSLGKVVHVPVVCNDRYRENCGVSAVAAHRQGLGAEVDELRGGFFRALHTGAVPGTVSTGTRPP